MPLISGALLLAAFAYGQPQGDRKLEFEVASIRPSAPSTGHFPAPATAKGGPGTATPTIFRCSNCTLAFLVAKAFALERYQFPGQSALPAGTYDVAANVPPAVTQAQFEQMLQNLLIDRFGLGYHFDSKQVQGYELVVAKNGPKLKESTGQAIAATAETPRSEGNWHGTGEHSRPGLMVFFGKAQYRGTGETTADVARMIATQLARPVEDKTGLPGKYDIALNWADDGSHAASHAPLQGGPGAGHGDRGEVSHTEAGAQGDAADVETLPGALQSQLGLKLVEAKKVMAKIFVVDRIAKTPAGN